MLQRPIYQKVLNSEELDGEKLALVFDFVRGGADEQKYERLNCLFYLLQNDRASRLQKSDYEVLPILVEEYAARYVDDAAKLSILNCIAKITRNFSNRFLVDYVHEAAASENAQVRTAAVLAVRKVAEKGDVESLDILRWLAEDFDDVVRKNASLALNFLSEKSRSLP